MSGDGVPRKERRVLRGCAWTAAIAAALVIGALVALQVAARRSESRLDASIGVKASRRLELPPRRSIPVSAAPKAEWPALARLAAEDIGGAMQAAPAAAAVSPADTFDASHLMELPKDMERSGWDFVYRLETAYRDQDLPIPDTLRGPLEAHAAELGVLTERLLREGEPAISGLDRSGLRSTRVLLLLDAIRLADAGDRHAARDRLAAVAYGCAVDATRGSNTTPWVQHGVLRRVRPPEPGIFLDILDSEPTTETYLAGVETAAFGPSWISPSFGQPTLDAVHEGLPAPLRAAVSALVLAPLDRMRRASAAPALLAARDEMAALGHCPGGTAWIDDPANADWASSWRWAVGSEADVLFTREVLRAALPEGEVEIRSSGCDAWSVTTTELGDGTRRVTLVGLGNARDDLPPSYDVPAPR